MNIITQAPSASPITVAAAGAASQTYVFAVIPGEPGAGGQCNLNVPGTNRLNAQEFVVRVAGQVQIGAGTYTVGVVPFVAAFGAAAGTFTAAAVTANAVYLPAIATITATAATVMNGLWAAEIHCQVDTASGKLTGYNIASGPITGANTTGVLPNGVPVAGLVVATTNNPTAINMASEPPMQFAVGVTLASATAGAVLTLTEFNLEA